MIQHIMEIPPWVLRFHGSLRRLEAMSGSYTPREHQPQICDMHLFGGKGEFIWPSYPTDFEDAANAIDRFCDAHVDEYRSAIAANWVGA